MEENDANRVMGYARVSSAGQNLDRQIMQLTQYVDISNIVVDKCSGKNLERPGYDALKGCLGLRCNDILYITSLDRLSRNKEDIKEELEWFQRNKIRLKILDLPTSLIEVPSGQEWILEMVQNILIEVISSIAQQERVMIRKRQSEGIAAAKAKGVHLGRKRIAQPDNFEEIYAEWKSEKITAKNAMKKLSLSSSSFYRMVKLYESKGM